MCVFCVVAGEDYLAIPPTAILLNDYNYSKCFSVILFDDKFLESTKTFTINITRYKLLPSSANFRLSTEINLESTFTEITLKDDDSKFQHCPGILCNYSLCSLFCSDCAHFHNSKTEV